MFGTAAQVHAGGKRRNHGRLRQGTLRAIASCKSYLAQNDRPRQMAILNTLIAVCMGAAALLVATYEELRFWIALIAVASAPVLYFLIRRHIRVPAGGCPYLGRGFAQSPSLASQAVLEAPDLEGMLRCAAAHLRTVFQSESIAIFNRSPQDCTYRLAAQAGLGEGVQPMFERDSPVLSRLRAVSVPPFATLPPCETAKLRATGGALIAPVLRGGELLAFINVGQRVSGSGYAGRDIALLSVMTAQLGLALEHLRLSRQEREDECARDIQQALLPRGIPHLPGYEIATAWRPARKVSGDYFDVIALGADKLAICIADVSGKGVPAALLMSNLQAAVRTIAAAHVTPTDLCDRVNRLVSGNIAPGRFITFFYCVLDGAGKTLAYTNAGHNAPFMIRRGGMVTRLEAGGVPLGILTNPRYAQDREELSCGDRLILFTDGLTEAGNSTGEELGEDRLVSLALKNPHAGARFLRSAIMDAMRGFVTGELEDDVTLVVVTVRTREGCAGCPMSE